MTTMKSSYETVKRQNTVACGKKTVFNNRVDKFKEFTAKTNDKSELIVFMVVKMDTINRSVKNNHIIYY